MRSIDEILTDIQEVQSQISALEADISNDESLMQTEEYRRGRRDYIDKGDSGVLTNMYSRDQQRRQQEWQRKMDEDRLALEKEQLEASKAEKDKDKQDNLFKLKRAANDAIYAYNNANELFAKDSTPQNELSVRGLKRAMENAMQDYVLAGGSTNDLEGAPTESANPGQGAPNTPWTLDANGLAKFDAVMAENKNKAKGKDKFYWADKDYDDAYEYARNLAGSNDPALRAAGLKYLSEIADMRKYRDSDRKNAEGAAAEKLTALQNEFNTLSDRAKANAAKDGWKINGKGYKVVKNTDGTYTVKGELKGK